MRDRNQKFGHGAGQSAQILRNQRSDGAQLFAVPGKQYFGQNTRSEQTAHGDGGLQSIHEKALIDQDDTCAKMFDPLGVCQHDNRTHKVGPGGKNPVFLAVFEENSKIISPGV